MNFLLNRGGAGKSLTRAETVSEISKLMADQIALHAVYDALIGELEPEDDAAETLKAMQKEHRVEMAKLSEIILSNTGTPPRKVESEPSDDLEASIKKLNAGERALREAVQDQLKLKHQMRTLAVLETILANTEKRIGLAQAVAQQHSVPVA